MFYLHIFQSYRLVAPHERDMVLMRHEIGIQWGDGKQERRGIDLVNYGQLGGFSAMAKTVGLPTGIAARMILSGKFYCSLFDYFC